MALQNVISLSQFLEFCYKLILRNVNVWKYFIYLQFEKKQEMAKKGNRVQVILECTEHKASGKPGTSRYISTKNKKNTPDRIELKKYNPILRRYTVHREIK